MLHSFPFYYSTLFVLWLASCVPQEPNGYPIQTKNGTLTVSLKRGDHVNYLECHDGDTITSTWLLNYPVYRFLKGDVNNDGQEDLAVGVIKTTRFDTVSRKRLFLFQVRNKAIIPLWLGSSLGHPLEDFMIRKEGDSLTLVRAVERDKQNGYLVAEYEWQGFGLAFREYLERGVSLEKAQERMVE